MSLERQAGTCLPLRWPDREPSGSACLSVSLCLANNKRLSERWEADVKSSGLCPVVIVIIVEVVAVVVVVVVVVRVWHMNRVATGEAEHGNHCLSARLGGPRDLSLSIESSRVMRPFVCRSVSRITRGDYQIIVNIIVIIIYLPTERMIGRLEQIITMPLLILRLWSRRARARSP